MTRRGVLVLVLAFAGCKSTKDDYPIDPGGGSGKPDAHPADAPADTATPTDAPRDAPADAMWIQIAGKVCLADDPTMLATCSATEAGGLTVQLGMEVATTAADGSFTISVPAVTGTWKVTGSAIATSVKVAAGASYQIPAITLTQYQAMISANVPTGSLQVGQGSLIAALHHAAGVAGATGTTTPSAADMFYDAGDPTTWGTQATSDGGVVWAAGLNPNTSPTFTVHPAMNLGTVTTTAAQPIQADSITFVDVNY